MGYRCHSQQFNPLSHNAGPLIFESGNGCMDTRVQSFFWQILTSLHFPDTPMGEVGDIPCSLGAGSCGPHPLHGQFPDLFGARCRDAVVNVDGALSGCLFSDGRTALLILATLLCRSHPAGVQAEKEALWLPSHE